MPLVLPDNPKYELLLIIVPLSLPRTFLCSTQGFKRNTIIFIAVNSPTAAKQIPQGHSCLQTLMHLDIKQTRPTQLSNGSYL